MKSGMVGDNGNNPSAVSQGFAKTTANPFDQVKTFERILNDYQLSQLASIRLQKVAGLKEIRHDSKIASHFFSKCYFDSNLNLTPKGLEILAYNVPDFGSIEVSLSRASTELRSLGMKSAIEEMILRTFTNFSNSGCYNLADKMKLISLVAGNEFGMGGVAVYPGGYMDVEHAILMGAKKTIIIDPALDHFGIANFVQKIKSYSVPEEELSFSKNGNVYSINLAKTGLEFDVVPSYFDMSSLMNAYPGLKPSAIILKKANGMVSAMFENEQVEGLLFSLSSGGHLLYSDLEREVARRVPYFSSKLAELENGFLQCFELYKNQDYVSHPFHLYQKK